MLLLRKWTAEFSNTQSPNNDTGHERCLEKIKLLLGFLLKTRVCKRWSAAANSYSGRVTKSDLTSYPYRIYLLGISCISFCTNFYSLSKLLVLTGKERRPFVILPPVRVPWEEFMMSSFAPLCKRGINWKQWWSFLWRHQHFSYYLSQSWEEWTLEKSRLRFYGQN